MAKVGQKFKLTDKLNTLDRVVLCASEFFGTAILVFLGCMSCAVGLSGGSVPHEQISLSFGLAVMISVQCFGHISGSHINPIVTIAAALMGDLALIEIPIYFIGQFAGAFAGYGLLMSVTPIRHQASYRIPLNGTGEPEKVIGICSPALNPDVTPFQGFFVEFLISLMLVLLCCGVWDHRNATKHDSVPIKFGLTIAVLALAGGPFTGANMNPARSFAPAAWHGDWTNHWAYWAGPILSAFAGAGLYRIVFSKPKPEETIDGIEIVPLKNRSG